MLIIKRVVSVLRVGGVSGLLSAIIRRIGTPRARCFPACRALVGGAAGLEIGGPSPIFARGGLIPLYPLALRVDNVNFAHRTLWEGAVHEGDSFTFHPGKAAGRQVVAEATDLGMIGSGSYRFVLSSHTLEHSANPLGALAEWRRLLEPGGGLVLVVPHRDGTFDHRRPITTVQHLLEDFEARRGEDDPTHFPEVLRLHDLSRDPGVESAEAFRDRVDRNAEVRSIHHHVFDTRAVVDTVGRAAFDILAVEALWPHHIVVLARKPLAGAAAVPYPEEALREALAKSPFRTDRQGL